MHQVYLLSVWVHILATMVWIGGASFIALVLVPAVRRPENAHNAPALLRAWAMRFRTVGWASLIILVVTGCLILALRGFTFEDCFTGRVFIGPFGSTLAIKLILIAAIFAISGLHDFYLGPNAAKVILDNPGSAEAAKADPAQSKGVGPIKSLAPGPVRPATRWIKDMSEPSSRASTNDALPSGS